jgi:hypothetical protein
VNHAEGILPEAAWKIAFITLLGNVIAGNLILAWVPLAAIRFNYTFRGLGLSVTVVAVTLLTASFWCIRASTHGFLLILLAFFGGWLIPVLGTVAWAAQSVPLYELAADGFKRLRTFALVGGMFLPLALPFIIVNAAAFFRFRRHLRAKRQRL